MYRRRAVGSAPPIQSRPCLMKRLDDAAQLFDVIFKRRVVEQIVKQSIPVLRQGVVGEKGVGGLSERAHPQGPNNGVCYDTTRGA